MATNRNAIDARLKVKGLGVVHEGQDHPAQCGIRVNIVIRDGKILHDFLDFSEIVYGAFHGGPDICKDDGGNITMDTNGLF